MLKVLEVFGEPISYGGQESFVFETVKAMDKSNLKLDFLTPYYCNNKYYENFAKEINAKIYTFNLPFKPGNERFNVIRPYCELLKQNKYDVVHINSGSISILALMTYYAKKNRVKKVLVHSHMAISKENVKHSLIKKLYSPIFRYFSDYLVAPTEAAGLWQFPKSTFSKKGHIIKNGIDLDKFQFNLEKRNEIRSKLNFSSNDVVLGNVGRLAKQKNQIFLINLLNYIIQNKKTNYKLLLVGDGELKDLLKEKIKKYNLADYVTFVGSVSNVNDYLQAMDIFLFPSTDEGLGIAGIEAQAVGLPVITSKQIPKDIKVTKDVTFLETNLNYDEWLEKIISYSLNIDRRKSNLTEIKNEGYSIKDTANNLKRLFLN